ncbi:MAG: hypothetical protein LKF31_02970 [Muribaculaceae bacterium]|jgi:hypothetical protein|nr:hypothetical protein [Muribaculaceae bacterium]
MKIINNNMLKNPPVGKFISEDKAINGLETNHLYLLAPVESEISIEAQKAIKILLDQTNKESFINKYDFSVFADKLCLENQPTMKSELESGNFNLILPLLKINRTNELYLIAKAQKEDLMMTIPLMFNTAEQVTRENLVEIIKRYAKEDTEDFLALLKQVFSIKDITKNLSLNSLFTSIPSFGMVTGPLISFMNMGKIYERLSEIVRLYIKGDKNAKMEIHAITKNIDPRILIEIFKRMPPSMVNKYCKYLNPNFLAKSSTLKFEIRDHSESYNKKTAKEKRLKNDGKFVLYLTKNNQEEFIHFGHKESFILYLIYLIDRYEKGTEVDTLKIPKMKKDFCNLFNIVYPGSGIDGASRFDRMVKPYISQGKTQKPKISSYYSEIRKKVYEACDNMNEVPVPFVISDPTSHIYTLQSNIIIDPSLLKEVQKTTNS